MRTTTSYVVGVTVLALAVVFALVAGAVCGYLTKRRLSQDEARRAPGRAGSGREFCCPTNAPARLHGDEGTSATSPPPRRAESIGKELSST